MSQHQAFKRVAVPAQVAQQLQTITIPAPTRGIIQSENEAFTQPGSATICDNWKPTMKGISLRGGCDVWCQLPETTPVISAFEYVDATKHYMYAANATKLYDVSTSTPVLVKSGQTSGNYAAAQLANFGGNWLIAVNDKGNAPLRFNGTSWTSLATTVPTNWANSAVYAVGNRARDTADNSYWKCAVAHTAPASGTFNASRTANPTLWIADAPGDGSPWITGPPGSTVEIGNNLTYVCKYRNRLFFVENQSMNAWYLGIDAVGGALSMIPLSGAASKGGYLLFCAVWSLDAGDGTDDKLVFCTNLGELLVFTGSNPADPANWRQEGRFQMSPPLGMNAHLSIGGDLLIATIEGILPTSAAVTKDRAELELAAVTRNVKPMWREEALDKRDKPWTMCNWGEYGGIFTTFPGDPVGKHRCLVTNAATGAHARFTGWDAMCWIRMHGSMYFGTQGGTIMQADRGGKDNGKRYVATLVGGWEMFQSPSQTVTWRQARASFTAKAGEPFQPQLSATTDFVVTLPSPPPAGLDPGLRDLWDQGLWGVAKWDKGITPPAAVRNTGWVSIGLTGFSHAPIVQVTVDQVSKPQVDMINIAAIYERAGVNV